MPKTIIVMGDTGHGKSNLISSLQSDFSKENYGEPQIGDKSTRTSGTTKKMSCWECKIKGHECIVHDTPGLNDPTKLIAESLAEMKDRILNCGIDLFLVCINVCDSNTSSTQHAAKDFIQNLKIPGDRKDDIWDRIVLVGTKSDKADDEEMEEFRDEKVPWFFEHKPKGAAQHVTLSGRYTTGPKSKKEYAYVDVRDVVKTIISTKCFGERGAERAGMQLIIDAEKYDSYVQKQLHVVGVSDKQRKQLSALYKQQGEILAQMHELNMDNLFKLKELEKNAKKRKREGEEQQQKFALRKANLRAMTVRELKAHCEKPSVGIKEPGTGWPFCCPRFGLKDDIINQILILEFT